MPSWMTEEGPRLTEGFDEARAKELGLINHADDDTQHDGTMKDSDGSDTTDANASSAAADYSHRKKKTREFVPRPGFRWRSGQERTTTGIWIYAQPFARTLPHTNETVAVLLLDTQGMFDFKTPPELTAAIFGLSTLISSFQIYNVSKQIQEDKLQQLHYFTEFSRTALAEFKRASKRRADAKANNAEHDNDTDKVALRGRVKAPYSASKKNKKKKSEDQSVSTGDVDFVMLDEEETKHPFQSITFLVRDWQNFDDEDDTQQCLKEMPAVLEHAMAEQIDDEGTRKELKRAFKEIGCFLLPHPGLKMTKKRYDGSLDVLSPAFVALLDHFVEDVFSNRLIAKEVNGRAVSADGLAHYVQAYAQIFKDGKLPKAMTLVQAMSATTNLCAKDDAVHVYRAKMKQRCGGDSFLGDDELQLAHSRAAAAAMASFDAAATFGEESDIGKARAGLEGDLSEEFVHFEESNRHKLHNGLQRFIIPLIIGCACWLLDLFTDYTCDSWSETCQKVSRLSALCYYGIFLAIGYVFVTIYRKQGSAVVGIGAMALGQASLERVDQMKKDAEKWWHGR